MAGMIALTEEIFDDFYERAAETLCEECAASRSYPCPCDGYIGESDRCPYGEKWDILCNTVERAKAMLQSI